MHLPVNRDTRRIIWSLRPAKSRFHRTPRLDRVIAGIATNRDCYAAGTLAAAKFLVGQAPGLYGMNDVLGL